jgi:CYTH domain-containing protein
VVDASKYAQLEDEQRFLVAKVPADATEPRQIEDRYLSGTRLRVRVVTGHDGVVRKLGHKVPTGAGPSSVWHTTMYLDEPEAAVLLSLPGTTVTKRRWTLPGHLVADEFLGRHEGLVLLEGTRPAEGPGGAVEVTADERFCGGSIARLDERSANDFVAHARAKVT